MNNPETSSTLPANTLLQGKVGLVMGIANEWSLAWHIAQAAHASGAKLVLTYGAENLQRRLAPLATQLGNATTLLCDVQNDEQIEAAIEAIKQQHGTLDFIVHAIGFANKDELRGGITNTTRDGFRLAMDVSCYSFLAVAKAAKPILSKNASLLTLTYLGGEKVVPNYNVMGVAKAALESATRYLAAEFGPDNIRVNAISAGPVNTLAARGIGDFGAMLNHHKATAPLRRTTSGEDVAGAALYLLSSLSQGVTGEIHYVDGGASTLGPTPFSA